MGCVYLLGDWEKEGFFKIGVTRGAIEKRIKKLQTGNGGEIYLVNSYEYDHPFILEKMLHDKYSIKKVLNEWYELSDEDVLNFKKTCEDLVNIINSLKNNPFFSKKIKS
jgi:hypothetical protein